MRSQNRGRAVIIAPSALGSKGYPAGPSKVPLRRTRQAIYPPRRIRRRIVEEKAPWRVSRHDNLPSSPSMVSRNEAWKAEGVSTFSRGVLVRGHGIHTHYFILCAPRPWSCSIRSTLLPLENDPVLIRSSLPPPRGANSSKGPSVHGPT